MGSLNSTNSTHWPGAASMYCWKTSKGCAPITGRPLIKKLGVLWTPNDRAALVSDWTVMVRFPESRHSSKASVSKPRSAANLLRFSLLNAPWFSPDWLSKILS